MVCTRTVRLCGPTVLARSGCASSRGPLLPRIRFHDLRHAHATHLLSSGVHPKVASERLGHSKVGITLDLYSHVMPGMQESAAAMVDDALQIALRSARKSANGRGMVEIGVLRDWQNLDQLNQ